MPRKERSDKGKPRENYQGVARKTRNATRSGLKYKTKPVEPRGKQSKEFRVQIAFWRNHTMDEVITWTPEIMEEKLTAFYEEYEARQIKADYKWWYPEDPRNRIVDLRYNK